MEHVVSLDDHIDWYYQQLEDGLFAPELLFNDGSMGVPGDRQLYHYILVVGTNELVWFDTFQNVVEDLSLSVEEPMEVMVVLMHTRSFLHELIALEMPERFGCSSGLAPPQA